MKKTMNFLNAIKAAKGKIVTQYEDRMLVVHINTAYGMIILIESSLILVLNKIKKTRTLTIR